MKGPKMNMRLMREREANVRMMTKSKVADEVMGEGKDKMENTVGEMGGMEGKSCWRWSWLLEKI
jgi:hypothetical protein